MPNKSKLRWKTCKLCGRKSRWKVEAAKCLFGCLNEQSTTTITTATGEKLADPANPPSPSGGGK